MIKGVYEKMGPADGDATYMAGSWLNHGWIMAGSWPYFATFHIAKAHRTHPVNSVLKRAHFLVTFSRASWHDTRQVTVCLLPHSLVIGEDCLYTKFSTCTAVVLECVHTAVYTGYSNTKFSTKFSTYLLWQRVANRMQPPPRLLGPRLLLKTVRVFGLKKLFYYGAPSE